MGWYSIGIWPRSNRATLPLGARRNISPCGCNFVCVQFQWNPFFLKNLISESLVSYVLLLAQYHLGASYVLYITNSSGTSYKFFLILPYSCKILFFSLNHSCKILQILPYSHIFLQNLIIYLTESCKIL